MLHRFVGPLIGLAIVLAITPEMVSQTTADTDAAKDQAFDPHDLSGVWKNYRPPGMPSPKRRPGGNYGLAHDDDNTIPEPPLTDWGKQHLLIKALSHDGLGSAPDKTDPNGVPANVPTGEYPGQKCESVSVPALYNYSGSYPFEFDMLKDRIYQHFEYHREWRAIWLNREHPQARDLDPTYMGDSIGKWDGDTLVVDTIGYNGKSFFSENVGQKMSQDFHLVERFRRLDHDHMQVEMIYADPKAWGDKVWPGWKIEFKLEPKSKPLQEFFCSPDEYATYDKGILNEAIK